MAEVPDLFQKTELNENPDLTMGEITAQLFNNEFLSDVQFSIDGKILFAHSLELMKRSVVFQNQMQANMGENKLIPIEDTCYAIFYQFLRFIYTDQCSIDEGNTVELIKLARKYNVYKLETKVINETHAILKLFEYCVLEKYDMAYNMTREKLAADPRLFKKNLTSVDSNVMEEILKFDYFNNLEETELFELLMLWINKSCETNQIPLIQRRSHFDKFIRLIRFPAMTAQEFSMCVQKHKDLLTNEDILTIFKQISFGADSPATIWSSKRRLKYDRPTSNNYMDCKASFSVSRITTLKGLLVANIDIDYTSSVKISNNNNADVKTFNFPKDGNLLKLVNFGESIVLKPNTEYNVMIPFKQQSLFGLQIHNVRRPSEAVILSGPPDVIQNLDAPEWVLEIIYKSEVH